MHPVYSGQRFNTLKGFTEGGLQMDEFYSWY